jgi:hypothetical protein
MAEVEGAGAGIPADNQRVYHGFLNLTKWAVIVIVIVLLLMGLLLT